jgi:hypothetical protein
MSNQHSLQHLYLYQVSFFLSLFFISLSFVSSCFSDDHSDGLKLLGNILSNATNQASVVDGLLQNGIINILLAFPLSSLSFFDLQKFLYCLYFILQHAPESTDTSLHPPFLMGIMHLTRQPQPTIILWLIFRILYYQIKKYPTLLVSSEFSSLFVSTLSKMIHNKNFLIQHTVAFLNNILFILKIVIENHQARPSYPHLIQLFHEEGMVEEFISLSSSLDPEIAA